MKNKLVYYQNPRGPLANPWSNTDGYVICSLNACLIRESSRCMTLGLSTHVKYILKTPFQALLVLKSLGIFFLSLIESLDISGTPFNQASRLLLSSVSIIAESAGTFSPLPIQISTLRDDGTDSGDDTMYTSGQQNQSAANAMAMRAGTSAHPGAQLTPQQLQQQAAMQNQQMGQNQNFPDTTKFVLDYLKRKGFSRTEAEFRLESAKTSTPPITINNPENPISANVPQSTQVSGGSIPIGGPVSGPMSRPKKNDHEDINWRAYQALSEWTDNSLDLYQPELRRVLFPVFVHLYLDLIEKQQTTKGKQFFEEFGPEHKLLHEHDLQKLAEISLPVHVTESDLAKRFKENKHSINLSRTTFDMLLFFLNELGDNGGSLVTQILNQHFRISVTTQRPSRFNNLINPEQEGSDSAMNVDLFNSQPVSLGKMPLDPDFENDVEMVLETKDNEDMKAAIASPNAGTLLNEFRRLNEKEIDSPARSLLPLPQYKEADIMAEVRSVADSRNRIRVGTAQASLPSVCMYTFHNTSEDLNTLAFSPDASLVAGGFSNSFVKIWSLKGQKLQGVLADDKKESYKTLIGHSGSVYGLSFSPDNRFLLSASEDKTVRLWSMDTYSALVSYKGHSHPVWDVSFGPFGHYFATASHDQTARLWSCDHIYPLRIFAGHLSDVDCVGWHPNGTYIVTGSSDKTCRMWDINSGASVRVFLGHTGPVSCTTVSPDGRWLASAGEDSIIHIWDLGSGRRLKSMKGHGKCSIYSLAFSQEGDVLVSSGSDCTVRVWDVKKNTLDQGPEPELYSVDGAAPTSASSVPISSAAHGGHRGSVAQANSAQLDLDGRRQKEIAATLDHLVVLNTKRTPVYKVQFSARNICLAGGAIRQ